MIEGKGVMRMKRRTQYVKWGLTAFLTVCAVLVFYDTFYMGGTLQHFVNKLFSVLAPVLYGCAIAYLLTPVMNWIERALHAGWQKAFPGKHVKNAAGVLRFASILLAEAVAILLVYLLMSVLIPQLVDSVTMLINNAEAYYYKVYNWADGLLDSENEIAVWVADFVTKYYSDGVTLLKDHILPWAQGALGTLTGGIWNGIWSVVSFATDLIVGIIVSIYLMTMKEKSLARCCKMIYATFQQEKAELILTTGGTGFSERDVTPEATEEVIERKVPGIPEAIRAYSMTITKRAMLSRATAGIRGKTLIVNLPGSPKAVRESLEYIIDALAHGLEILSGEARDCARK